MNSKKNKTFSGITATALLLLVIVGILGLVGLWKIYQESKDTNALLTSIANKQESGNQDLAKLDKSFKKIIELSEETNTPSQPQPQKQPTRVSGLNTDNVKIKTDVLTYGNKEARFSLVTYMDFQCPYCQRHAATPRTLVDSANEGLVNWKWKNSPLPMHEPIASEQAKKFICAGKQDEKHYWDIVAKWGSKELNVSDAELTAKYKLDTEKYETCLKDENGEVKNAIEADKAESMQLGISATPTTLIIDNKTGKVKPIEGAVPMDQFITAIEEMAKKDS
ncbi:thioredoxin domain-containing protein [Xenorhabdus sp. TH1]|uniref:DsbA family protein n=1 Tax=Xenorhabdus sp. TH1 TaxID=3130166 RepID=UPI0030CD0EA2